MPDYPTLDLCFLAPDIALATLNTPDRAVNLLTLETLGELTCLLDDLEKQGAYGLIIRSAKPNTFVVGTDLTALARRMAAGSNRVAERCDRGRAALSRLSDGSVVTVAAIDGVCLGAGAELAAWCDFRIVTDSPKTQIGFPEVRLGLIPGWGGTVRLPSLVGLGNAVDLITSGRPVDARRAVAIGLADDICASDQLQDTALRLLQTSRSDNRPIEDRRRQDTRLQMPSAEVELLIDATGNEIRSRTQDRYPAPLAALGVLAKRPTHEAAEAGFAESQAFSRLFGSPVNRALLNVFFLTDRNKRDRGADGRVDPEPARSLGVLGAGIMGQSVAAAAIKSGVPTKITDASSEAIQHAIPAAIEESIYNPVTRSDDPELAPRHAALLSPAATTDQLADCDLIIEAIVENLEVKRQVFQRLEPQLAEHAVLASNTSTIPIAQLAECLDSPSRMCGIHFFNPVKKMRLVEVIRAPQTSDRTIATAVAFAKGTGKMPVVVNDGPGFLVNRLLMPYLNESFELLSEGISVQEVDDAAVHFGMPMGPLALCDMIGLDTALYAGRYMWEAFPDRVHPSPILPAMVKRGRLGWKNGLGFFAYDKDGSNARPDPAAEKIIETYLRNPRPLNREQIQQRLFLPVLLEATRSLTEGIVRDCRDVDTGVIFALGFPRFRGGLMFWADTIGNAQILEMLKPWEPLGARMQPTEMLLELAREKRAFYAPLD